MPRPPLTDAAMSLLAQPNPAVIVVVRPDGQPVSVATWYLLEDDGRILVNMDGGRKRLAYMRHEPRVSLTVLDENAWARTSRSKAGSRIGATIRNSLTSTGSRGVTATASTRTESARE